MGLLFSRRHTIDYVDLDNSARDEMLKVMKGYVESHYKKANSEGYTIFIGNKVDFSNISVTNIPFSLWYNLINKITQKPFIKKEMVYENGTEIKINFVINSKNSPPSALLARSAVLVGLKRGDICAITLEPLADSERYCVNNCGHVFSDVSLKFEKCPLCNRPACWATVSRDEILDT